MKKQMYVSCILVACLFIVMGTVAFAEGGECKDRCDSTTTISVGESEKKVDMVREQNQIIQDFLKTEDDIQYYAYLDIKTVAPDVVPVIIEARNKIISRQSWVADSVQGFVYDENGNLIEKVPQFSELFPEGWSVPILSTEVDLSYYGR